MLERISKNNVVCPYCGACCDNWEDCYYEADEIVECDFCENLFSLEIECTPIYTTRTLEDDCND